MWVLTEDGQLVNISRFDRVRVHVEELYRSDGLEDHTVVATGPGGLFTLCKCDDEEHGRRIIETLAFNAKGLVEQLGYVPMRTILTKADEAD